MRVLIAFGFGLLKSGRCHAQTESIELSDEPILGSADVLKINNWIASAGGFSVDATVPGDLVTDLERGAGYGDPLFSQNWLNTSYDGPEWVMSATFDVPTTMLAAKNILLVFDSVKMGATVSLNNINIGVIQDQFLRYNFSVGELLNSGSNVVSVAFAASDESMNLPGRYMACSGGWDWAPYSATKTASGGQTYSRGILRDVYLVPVSGAALSHAVVLSSYAGEFPTTPLVDGSTAAFESTLDVVLWVPTGASAGGRVSATVSWSPEDVVEASLGALSAGEAVVSLKLPPAVDVDLWWPLGLGAQSMYV